MRPDRTLPWDWYDGFIPDNVVVDATAYIETTFSFDRYRSEERIGVEYGRGSSSYLGTMFDVGPHGRVHVGDYVLLHGARFICDSSITVGDYTMMSWNVVIMDSMRAGSSVAERRRQLRSMAHGAARVFETSTTPRPVVIGRNVWIGFDVCVMPGVTIGDGSIVGAKSVVTSDVPANCVVAGNPARVIRTLDDEAGSA